MQSSSRVGKTSRPTRDRYDLCKPLGKSTFEDSTAGLEINKRSGKYWFSPISWENYNDSLEASSEAEMSKVRSGLKDAA